MLHRFIRIPLAPATRASPTVFMSCRYPSDEDESLGEGVMSRSLAQIHVTRAVMVLQVESKWA
jgi:hypothetical protein